MNKRIDSLDILKAFAIFLVVWGHVLQHCLSTVYYDEPVYRIIYSFHMPLFMILAGFFSHKSLKLPLGNMAVKKVKELIVPCITWGGVIYVLQLLFQAATKNSITFSYSVLFDLLIKDYWFLKSLFICYLLAWFSFREKKYSALIVIIGLLLSQFINVYNLSIMYPCFIIGYYLKSFIDHPRFVQCRIFYGIVFLALLMFAFNHKELFDVTAESKIIETGVNSIFTIILWRLIKISMGVSGSLAIISLMRKRHWNVSEDNNKAVHYVCEVGKRSLGIYLVHTLIVSYFMASVVSFDTISPLLFNTIIAPLLSIAILIVCMVVIYLLENNRVIRIVFFGR